MCTPNLRDRYVNFYTDFAFKKLFGSEMNKDLLISFLNALLNGKEEIVDLTYKNPAHLGAVASDRKAVFDVYCETVTGEKILIEMQKAEQKYFKDRSIFYSTFPIQEFAPQGDWDFKLGKVYTVGILNFTLHDTDADYMHHEVKLMDTRSHEVFYDKLTYIYLEMPKFHKTEDELETLFDKWLYAMKNLGTLMERPKALREAVFVRLFEQAEIAQFDENELRDYRESQKDYWDLYSITKTAEDKGIVKGIEIGEARGIEIGEARATERERLKSQEKILSIARGMKNEGMPMAMIAKFTGLTEKEIESL